MARYLGLDYGEKRIGVALSDPTGFLAQPLKTIHYRSQKEAIAEIVRIVQEQEVAGVVLGLPLGMSGQDTEKTREVRQFAEKLRARLPVPLELLDERLTTRQAQQTLRQMGKKPSKHRNIIDQMAAQYILQTFLERRSGGK